jgi:hypothetical protein
LQSTKGSEIPKGEKGDASGENAMAGLKILKRAIASPLL